MSSLHLEKLTNKRKTKKKQNWKPNFYNFQLWWKIGEKSGKNAISIDSAAKLIKIEKNLKFQLILVIDGKSGKSNFNWFWWKIGEKSGKNVNFIDFWWKIGEKTGKTAQFNWFCCKIESRKKSKF